MGKELIMELSEYNTSGFTYRNISDKDVKIIQQGKSYTFLSGKELTIPSPVNNKSLIPKTDGDYIVDDIEVEHGMDGEFEKHWENRFIKVKKYYENCTPKQSVSIIILNKNHPDLIIPCIDSILGKVKYDNLNIVVGDTGTTNKKVLKYYEKIQKENGIVIKFGLDYDFGRNYNQLINEDDSDFCVILNSDTIAHNDFVTKMMIYALNNHVGAVGAQLLYPNGTIQHIGQQIYDKNGKMLGVAGHHCLGVDPKNIKLRNLYIDGVTCACMLIKRTTFLSVGGFDLDYKDVYQDVDLNLKLRRAGYSIWQCNDAVLTHWDNATRKGVGKIDIRPDIATLQKKWLHCCPPIINPKKPVFTIVTLTTNILDYSVLLDSINTDLPIEIISIDNRDNTYTSPEGLNIGLELATSPYVVLCHQDIAFCDRWFERVSTYIKEFDKSGYNKFSNWGVLGIVGVSKDKSISFLANDTFSNDKFRKNFGIGVVDTVDELCMVVKKNDIRFDENIDGYHFYGADICMQQKSKGMKNIVINCPVKHYSLDGTKNLNSDEKWNEFRRLAYKFREKWRNVGYIATTTTVFEGKRIIYSLASRLKRSDIDYFEKFRNGNYNV